MYSLAPPMLSGSASDRLSAISDYLFYQSRELENGFSDCSPQVLWAKSASAVDNKSGSDAALRSLIIKTATVAVEESEGFRKYLSGKYLALSEFGSYFRHTTAEISGSSYGITELFTYSSELCADDETERVETKSYIKEGLLDTSGTVPVYGVEIGNISGGAAGAFTRITPDSWELWSGSEKLAYTSAYRVYFPYGSLVAQNATISGAFTAGSINTDAVSLGSENGGFATAEGFDGVNVTSGAMMFGAAGVPLFSGGVRVGGGDVYIIATENGCRMTAGGTSLYITRSDAVLSVNGNSVSLAALAAGQGGTP